jgi:hypothetical protein
VVFHFQNRFWVNLHHFLYVLGRAQDQTPDSRRASVAGAPKDVAGFEELTDAERRAWNDAVRQYQQDLSKKDLVFDGDLVAITSAVAKADDGASLPQGVRETLEKAGPIYRKVWWQRHSGANQSRIEELESLLARHGRTVSDIVTRAYHQRWPAEGFTVQVTAYASWAGAYSTAGGLIVLGSHDEAGSGAAALETVFHEAMHQWDDAMIPLLHDTARRLNVQIPRDLSHSLIFYTAGYAVSATVPGHRPFWESLQARGVFSERERMESCWLPYLKGEGTLEAALERLVQFPRPPRPPAGGVFGFTVK